MKVKLKKPAIHNDAMYREESVINMTDLGRAKFFVETGIGVTVPDDTPLSDHIEPPKPLRSAQADQIGQAIVEGIQKASKAMKSEKSEKVA
jgi:hypothetical protein